MRVFGFSDKLIFDWVKRSHSNVNKQTQFIYKLKIRKENKNRCGRFSMLINWYRTFLLSTKREQDASKRVLIKSRLDYDYFKQLVQLKTLKHFRLTFLVWCQQLYWKMEESRIEKNKRTCQKKLWKSLESALALPKSRKIFWYWNMSFGKYLWNRRKKLWLSKICKGFWARTDSTTW